MTKNMLTFGFFVLLVITIQGKSLIKSVAEQSQSSELPKPDSCLVKSILEKDNNGNYYLKLVNTLENENYSSYIIKMQIHLIISSSAHNPTFTRPFSAALPTPERSGAGGSRAENGSGAMCC